MVPRPRELFDAVPSTEEGTGTTALNVAGLTKVYDDHGEAVRAVDGISLSVRPGEFVTLLGPSGCGKTTTLRMIAGLEVPTAGEISISGELVYSGSSGLDVPVHRRDISLVFQSYALWPHMTVAENVAFPLRMLKVPRAERAVRVDEALSLVGLAGYQARYASALSGGQQQRVALARALVKRARLLLLDEPLSNLDARLRLEMRKELTELQGKIGITTIYVTHDQEEALSMSSRVVVMQHGQVVESASPTDLYLRPASVFGAEFIGHAHVWPGRIEKCFGDHVTVSTSHGQMLSLGRVSEMVSGEPVSVVFRPESLRLRDSQAQSPAGDATAGTHENILHGTVEGAFFAGRYTQYTVRVGTDHVRIEEPSMMRFRPSQKVQIVVPMEACWTIRGVSDNKGTEGQQ